MSMELLALVTSIVTLLVLVYMLWKSKLPFTLSNINNALVTARPIAEQLVEIARTGAAAAEMLANTGKLPKDQKFNYALDYVLSLLPVNHGFTKQQIVGAIEAGAFLVDTMGKAIENGNKNVERP